VRRSAVFGVSRWTDRLGDFVGCDPGIGLLVRWSVGLLFVVVVRAGRCAWMLSLILVLESCLGLGD